MIRSSVTLPTLAALCLTLAACGPLEDDPSTAPTATRSLWTGALAAPDPGLQVMGGSVQVGLRLDASTLAAGAVLSGTVSAGGGAVVYLGFPRAIFAGPRFVRIPSGQRSATFTLHSNPFLSAAALATISARTQNPDPATYTSQAITVLPKASPPAGPAPQVAAAVLTPATVVSGGGATLALTLTAPAPAEGAAILLAISNDFFFADADLPPVAIVPPGATRLDVPIRTHLSNAVATEVTEYLVANSFGGPFQGEALLVTAR